MYHTRPIKTYDLLTALIDRVGDALIDQDPQYDDVLSNVGKDELKELLVSLIKFNEAFLEGRDG